MEKLSKEFGKNLTIMNDQDYGKFYFQLYIFEKDEEFPTCIAKFLVEETEDLWERLGSEGIRFDEWYKTKEHPFFKMLSQDRICLIDVENIVEDDMFRFIENGENVIVFVKYEDIAKMTREDLLKEFLQVYLRTKGYDVKAEDYDIQVIEDEIISFLE